MVRIVNWTFKLVILFTIQTLRLTFLFIRLALPWIIRAAWSGLMMVSASVISVFVGLPTYTQRIADHWLRQAVDAGFPSMFDTSLFQVLRVVAYLMIFFGWIMLASITVMVLRIIF